MQRFWSYQFRRTSLLLVGYAALLGGIGLVHSGRGINPWCCWLSAASVLVLYRLRTILSLVVIIIFCVSLGMWHGGLFARKLAVYQPLYYKKITLQATASEDATYNKYAQLSFNAGNVRLEDGSDIAGKLLLSGFGFNSVLQGDTVQATGKLYPGYGSYQGRISYAQIQVVQHHPSLVAEIRRKFAAGVQTALPEPAASFGMGLLIGQRATLPDETKQELLMVGLTHIIAVSGYNLTIILKASKGLLARRSKRLQTLFSISLIGVFLLLTGSSASIVRAAIVSMLSITATYYGRSFKPVGLIMLAAAITAWANPVYLWSDVSWYLSFLAFYGVLVLAPLIAIRFRKRWQDSLLAMVALESICAELMTMPFVLHTFGQMSLIGLPANVLVVTLIPLAMLLSLFAGLAGMFAGSLSGWFAWPARIVLTYMLDVAHILSNLPHIFLKNLSLPIAGMLVLYGIVVLLTLIIWFKAKTKSAIITDRIEA